MDTRKNDGYKRLLLHVATSLKVHTNTLTEIRFQFLFAHVVARLLIQGVLKSVLGHFTDQLLMECTELHNDEIRNSYSSSDVTDQTLWSH